MSPSGERKLSVAVIQGGPSSEAEVSRASAKSVAAALAKGGHRVVRHELDAFLSDSLRTGGYEVMFPVSHGAVGEDGSLQGLLEVLDVPYVGSNVLASALAMNKRIAKLLFGQLVDVELRVRVQTVIFTFSATVSTSGHNDADEEIE